MAIGDPDELTSGTPADSGGSSDASASAPTPITLTDETLVRVPGRNDPVAWREYMQGYRPSAEVDRARQQFDASRQEAERILMERARQLDDRQRRMASGQPSTPPAASDPLEKIRSLPVVNGQTIVDLVEGMRAQGRPMTEWAQAINQHLGQSAQRLQSLEARLEPFERNERDQEITSDIDAGLRAAGVDLGKDGLADGREALRDMATNVYYGWHPSRQDFPSDEAFAKAVREFRGEFPTLLGTHLEAIRKASRLLDRVEADEARRRLMPTRGGTASPNGARSFEPRSAAQMASDFFAARSSEATT